MQICNLLIYNHIVKDQKILVRYHRKLLNTWAVTKLKYRFAS